MTKIRLNSNQLKLIAAVSMLLDHVGYFLFPTVTVFRILGRLAFPIFAFCISEGCRYTKTDRDIGSKLPFVPWFFRWLPF